MARGKQAAGRGARGGVLADMDKRFGKGVVMRLGDAGVGSVEAISTGSIALDDALGVGGYPRGRVVEIFGPEASGKTTLTLHAVAEAQRAGGLAAFIDAEHALDFGYARSIGVDPARVLVSQPDSGEQALEVAEALIRSGEVDLVVVDSVAALTPRNEIEGEMGDAHVGLQARLMSQALRKIAPVAHQTNTTVLFINQLRQKIGVTFGSGETTTGGRALRFYASVRLDIRRIATLKDSSGKPFGNRARVKVAKNKVAPPFRQCEVDIIYGRGVCRPGELLDLGVELGLVDKAGAWLSWQGGRLGQGRERAREALLRDPSTRAALEAAVRRALGGAVAEVDVSVEPGAAEEGAVEPTAELDLGSVAAVVAA